MELQCFNLYSFSNIIAVFLVTKSFMNFAYPGIFSNAFIKGTLMESSFNIDMNLQYVPSWVFWFNLCAKGGGGLFMGTTLWVHWSYFSAATSVSPITTTSSLSFSTIFLTSNNMGGSIVYFPPRVVISIQYPMLLLGSYLYWRWFNMADNWLNCCSNCLIDIELASIFSPIPYN